MLEVVYPNLMCNHGHNNRGCSNVAFKEMWFKHVSCCLNTYRFTMFVLFKHVFVGQPRWRLFNRKTCCLKRGFNLGLSRPILSRSYSTASSFPTHRVEAQVRCPFRTEVFAPSTYPEEGNSPSYFEVTAYVKG